ncbi:hypothetical protein A2U01_0001523 [Trifolium medium]|uniref:Putative plant transposon protein domain-containing protein n=1 Tax=Trifolium medium TaxID=97028 RepID=A0A392M0F5_9FABA|nr:hypothetical protein [Trifolium medium]
MARTNLPNQNPPHNQNVSSSSPPKSPDLVLDLVSSPSDQSIVNLTQTTSDPAEDSQNLSEIFQINLNSLSKSEDIRSIDLITPISTIVVPSTALTPPILTQPKRTKTVDRLKARKSARNLSSFDTTIRHSDSENTLSGKSLSSAAKTKQTSKTKTTFLSPPSSLKKEKLNKGKAKAIYLKDLGYKHVEIKHSLVLPSLRQEFEATWKMKPVAETRFFQLESLYARGINLYKFLDPQGWTEIFRMKDTTFPHVAQSFYFNASTFAEKNLIISYVKGEEIHLTPEVIGKILRIPCEGTMVYGPTWYKALNVKKEELILELFTKKGQQMEDPKASLLKKEYRILHNICQYCIFPRLGSMEKVTDNDYMVLYHLSKKIKLNLPYVIIQHMIKTVQSGTNRVIIPYGVFLTKIFRYHRVNLREECSENDCHSFSSKDIFYMHFDEEEVTDDEDVRAKRKRQDVEIQENWNFLVNSMMEQSKNMLRTPNNEGNKSNTISSPLGNSFHFDPLFKDNLFSTEQRAGKFLHGFYSTTTPFNTSLFSPVLNSSQGSMETFLSTDPVQQYLNTGFTMSAPIFSDGTMPSLPTSFATIDSFCSSAQPNSSGMPEKDSENVPRPPKKSKIEKDVGKLRKNMLKLFEGLSNQNDMLQYLMIDTQVMRDWMIHYLCPSLKIFPPPANYAPPALDFPKPDNSTSSDDSSPIVSE